MGQNEIFFLLIIVAVLLILLINIRLRAAAEKQVKASKEKLEESYEQLEEAYKEVSATQLELNDKYEELKRSEEKIKKLAYMDDLTELPNRTSFTERLTQTMETLGKDEVVGITFIDLDNFKNINDTLGHSYGDELLLDVSHRLRQVLGDNDFLARFGGDEFIILTQNIEDFGVYEDKLKKVQKVFSYPFVLAMKEFFVTVSMGITLAPKDGKTTQSIIKNVDAAMYEAKAMGKNTYCYFHESINEKLMEKIELQSELRKAMENEELELYYQAQIDLSSNEIIGFEALLRWNHPVKGVITPMNFIPLAEETGLIISMGEWVLREACKQLRYWEMKYPRDINMAVNLSARQFMNTDIVTMVKNIIEETGIKPEHLELEITETVALDNIEYSIETIGKLKEVGVRFSLDDFGTGYSSMNYLKQLPVNNLKIDKSFLDTVMDNTDDQKIVSTIISLAQTLKLSVIAEGVEYDAQESFLKDSHCNKAQGYLYSKPIPRDEAEKLISN